MKLLVTGASGFIGSTLIDQLNQARAQGESWEIKALLRNSSSLVNLQGLEYERAEGSIQDAAALRKAMQGVDAVVHLAGVTAGRNRDEFFKHNAEGARRVIEAAAEVAPALKKFILVSSLAAAGPAPSLQAERCEEDVESPVSFYGESKLAGEKEVLKYSDKLPVFIVRPPIVYGPKDQNVFIFVKTVNRNMMPLIQTTQGGSQKIYSTVYSADLVRGVIQLLKLPSGRVASGTKFYFADHAKVSMEELLGVIAKTLGKNPVKFTVPKLLVQAAGWGMEGVGRVFGKSMPLNRDKLNELWPDYWVCSNQKACKELGYAPEFDLEKGMRQTVEWYRAQGWIGA